MTTRDKLEVLARQIRFNILKMTTTAGSGHPTSSLSATDLLTCLFFDKLRFDLKNPQNPNNDRVIFSKGHATPLFYSLYKAAGVLSEKELLTYRKMGSPLEGHPTPRFKYTEAATGSLGQGLSIGVGMALAARLEYPMSNIQYPIIYVLLGDGEMAEGSVWEAAEIASFYKLGNLVAIVDVNRLGQSGETMLGWNTDVYRDRLAAFGWEVFVVDGHNYQEIIKTFNKIEGKGKKPMAIIAKTIKGKGVSFLENKEGWHGKALPREDFEKAVAELGEVDQKIVGEIERPVSSDHRLGRKSKTGNWKLGTNYQIGEEVATRKAYGETLVRIYPEFPEIVVLDGETSNSTYSEIFKKEHPGRYFEMFIAEQNMVGVAVGLARRGKIPFVSTFSAFFTRAFDQIRMSAISGANIKFVGSHAGVSIGEDGPSQMGLEDLAMFSTVYGSTVFCPGDAIACAKLVRVAAEVPGIFYIRTNRPATPVIYGNDEEFKVGGSKVVRLTKSDQLTIVACGVTLTQAIEAADELKKEGINVRVIDAYSIKPIDEENIKKAAKETNGCVLTVEDHHLEGGLGDAVLNVFGDSDKVRVYKLGVLQMPMSGKGDELLDYEGISASKIVAKVKKILE